MKKLLFIMLLAGISLKIYSQEPVLVKAIDDYYEFRSLMSVNNQVYMIVNDFPEEIFELWVSNGTSSGTKSLMRLAPEKQYFLDVNPNLTGVNGKLFFIADDGTHGYELWCTDGTVAGTYMVKDIYSGSNSGILYDWSCNSFFCFNNTLYFIADDGAHGYELWKSDGTESGTIMVKDINPDGSSIGEPFFTSLNNKLYFVAYDPTHKTEIWESDGTNSGTHLFKDISPNTGDDLRVFGLQNVNNTIYFGVASSLWKTDGTDLGTKFIKKISDEDDDYITAWSYQPHFTYCNGLIYFDAQTYENGIEVWVTDGTETNTRLLKDIFVGERSGVSYDNPFFTVSKDTLFFVANDDVHGEEIWYSTGTEPTTNIFQDYYPDHYASYPKDLVTVNGEIYFLNESIKNSVGDYDFEQICKIANKKIERVTNLYTEYGANPLKNLINVNGTLFFTSQDYKLYKYTPPFISVSPTSLNLPKTANSTASFNIQSNIEWGLECDESWLSLSSLYGTNNATITVTATENTTGNPRTAIVTIWGDNGNSETVAVTQTTSEATLTLSVSPTTLSINAAANSTSSFSITSNTSWTAISSQNWLTLSSSSGSNNGTITVTAAANTLSSSRTATVTVSGTGVTSKTVTITQAAVIITPTLTVSPTTLSINAVANSTSSFSITSNTSWTAISNQNWLTLSSSSGSNNGTITVTAAANTLSSSRTATVTVSGTGVTSKTVTITQVAVITAPTLTVSPTTLSISAAANSKATFNITSNISWTVSSNQSWLTLSGSSGSNNGSITVTAAANASSSSRIATITISGIGVTPQTIAVTQLDMNTIPTLSVSSQTLSVNATANSNSSFSITTNVSWTASSSKSWLTLSSPSGSTSTAIILTAAANTVTSPRIAIVTVTGSGVTSKTIVVTQNAALPALSVSPTTLSIGAAANSKSSFSITANQGWTASSNQNWLTLNGTAGLYNVTIIATAKANPVNTPREALVTVSSSGVDSKVISITQEAGTVVTGDVEVNDDNIKIYPNPFTDKVRVTLSNTTPNAYIGIYNLNGIQLYNYEVKDGFVEFDMTKYPSGLYFVRIKTPNEVVAKRVVKY